MFGAVTSGTVADELKHQFDISLDKRKIHLDHPIRTLGDHDIELRLHHDVVTSLKIKVESTTPPPERAEAPVQARGRDAGRPAARGAAKPGEAPPKTEKRGRRPEPAKSEKTDKPEKPEKPVKGEKAEKPAKSDKAK